MTTNHLKYLIFRTCITSILLAVVTAGDRQADVCQFLSCLPRRRRFCPPAWKSFCRRNPLLLTLLRLPRIICTVVGVCLSRSLLDVKDSQDLLDSLFIFLLAACKRNTLRPWSCLTTAEKNVWGGGTWFDSTNLSISRQMNWSRLEFSYALCLRIRVFRQGEQIGFSIFMKKTGGD